MKKNFSCPQVSSLTTFPRILKKLEHTAGNLGGCKHDQVICRIWAWNQLTSDEKYRKMRLGIMQLDTFQWNASYKSILSCLSFNSKAQIWISIQFSKWENICNIKYTSIFPTKNWKHPCILFSVIVRILQSVRFVQRKVWRLCYLAANLLRALDCMKAQEVK